MSTDMDLETRLRIAGASLHRAVDPIAADAPPRPAPADRRPMLAAAAAVLVLLAITAAAFALRDGKDDRFSTDPESVPRLVVGQPLHRLEITGAVDLPMPAADTDTLVGYQIWFALYRAEDGSDVAILVETGGEPGDGEPATVRGHDAVVDGRGILGEVVSWQERDDLLITLASHTATRTQLVAAAEDALLVEGDDVSLAEPFERLGVVPDLSLGLGLPVSASAVGHVVGLQEPSDAGAAAYVATVAGTEGDLAVLRWLVGADEPLAVRGHDGWVGSVPGEDGAPLSRGLVWREAPGVLGVVQGYGLGRDEVVQLAEGLTPATDAVWEQLVERSTSATPRDAEVAIEGDYGGGTWSVYVGPDGLCGEIAHDDGGEASCGDPSPATVLAADVPLAVYGEVPESAVSVTSTDGDVSTRIATSEDGTTTIYAIVLDGAPVPEQVVFLDDTGHEIARHPTGGP